MGGNDIALSCMSAQEKFSTVIENYYVNKTHKTLQASCFLTTWYLRYICMTLTMSLK